MEISPIRACHDGDQVTMLGIINAAAESYRGAIPPDRWHDPYMSLPDLRRDIAAGVEFWGYEIDGALIGIMGIQAVKDVELIRHAYVRPDRQRHGAGTALLGYLKTKTERRLLVGTWAAATWAIAFYERNGFDLVSSEKTPALLRRYWSIPDRQIETSAVLERRKA